MCFHATLSGAVADIVHLTYLNNFDYTAGVHLSTFKYTM